MQFRALGGDAVVLFDGYLTLAFNDVQNRPKVGAKCPPNPVWRHAETPPAVIRGMLAELHRHLDIVLTDQDSQPVVVPVVTNTDRFW
jgi:hypothetical protein